MGDHNAVDYTQVAHCNVLRPAGCLHDADLLVYGDPLPRSGTYEGITVDDHVVFQKVPRREVTREGREAALARVALAMEGHAKLKFRDERVLVDAVKGYRHANLEPKTNKSVRFQTEAESWGAHVEGERAAVRSKDEILGRAVDCWCSKMATPPWGCGRRSSVCGRMCLCFGGQRSAFFTPSFKSRGVTTSGIS